jgi:hypothetical protein
MNERIVVPSAGLKLSNRAQPLTVEVIKPPRDQSITVEPSDSHSTKLDLSVAPGEKLDSPGKPFPYLDAERDAGHSINGEQFKAVASVVEDQPVLSEAGKIPPSAANFHDVSIDLLPGGSLPLALLGQEGRSGSGNLFTDAGGASQHNLAAVGSVPGGITIPGSGGAATLVFEGGLGPRAGEPAGSHTGQPSFPTTTKAGTIGFTSLDGVQTVSLGGHILSGTPQTFTDATGSRPPRRCDSLWRYQRVVVVGRGARI